MNKSLAPITRAHLTPFNGTSNGDAFREESDSATAGFPVRPGTAAAAAPPAAPPAAAEGAMAVETDRRNLLWYGPPTVGGEDLIEESEEKKNAMSQLYGGKLKLTFVAHRQ